MFQYFHEADDQVTCTNITKNIHDRINLYYLNEPLLPSDITCFITFLTNSKKDWNYLFLSSCYIGDAGLKMVYQSLVTSGVTIESIFLDNNLLSSQSEEVLAEMVTTFKIQCLYLQHNNFADGLDLSNNSTLESLYISHNNLSSTGASRLFSTLRSNKHTNLRRLNIDNNDIGDEAVNDITQFLMEKNVLKFLDVSNNKFTEQGIIIMLGSLHCNRSLIILKISKHFSSRQIAEESEIRESLSISFV